MSALRLVTEIDGMELPSTANLRGSWRKHASRTQTHRRLGRVMLAPKFALHSVALRAALAGDGITVRITRVAPRPLDDDNLASACKALRDGIADALRVFGVRDDRDARVRWQYAQARGAPHQRSVRIEVVA